MHEAALRINLQAICVQFIAGGHTAEMFKVLDGLNKSKYQPRIYVAAITDKLAPVKVQHHEQRWAAASPDSAPPSLRSPPESTQPPQLCLIPRSREVGQSWPSSAFTTLWAALFSLAALLRHRPQLLLANGPGTCLPLCLIAAALRQLHLLNCKIVFVESIARTRKLSMTGQVLYKLRAADRLLVQWEQLQAKHPRAVYAGRVY